ncbi:MAG: glycosyltransferase family 2 protein [bacterium]|nr:glycosyltransferase family 2 protein [bacterium]
MKTICILPAYNEEGKIGRVIRKIQAVGIVDEIVVADDCSSDNTSREATEFGATVIRHETNLGVGAGIRSGIKYGIEQGYDIGVVMSGDDQHEPKELPQVLDRLKEKKENFVQGSRRLTGGDAVSPPLFREVTTRLYSLAFTVFTFKRITDCTNGFRAFYLSMFADPKINLDQEWLNTYELEPYLLYKAATSGKYNVVEVPITVYYRGETKQYSKMKPFRDWWRLVRPLIFLRFGIKK